MLDGVGVEKADGPVDGHKGKSQDGVVDQGESRCHFFGLVSNK